jgi:phage terminase large subunit GpA-like protein
MTVAEYQKRFAEALMPPPQLSVAEWADTYRQLPSEGAAEPGQWRTARTPYMREILDCLSDHHAAREIVLIKGAQLGGTEALLNFIGYIMHHAPGPSMVVMPTEETARDWSRDRLTPMIQSTPELKKLFGTSAKNPNNATSRKAFPGGYIKIVYATSAAGLRSRPVRYLLLDEIDGYPSDVDGEGDPVELAEARTRTFSGNKKVVKVSTPTFHSTSRIEPAYQRGTQSEFQVPCPHCDVYQSLVWEQVKWPKGNPDAAYYECAACGAEIRESDKTAMLARGRFQPQNLTPEDGVYSYRISSLYSPDGWLSWAECAKKFVNAAASRNKELLRVFVNTILGETWRDKGETPDWEKLYLRRSQYARGTVPAPGRVLTAGVDVQRDRLEVEIVAWGEGQRSWSIDFIQLAGDPSQPEVWAQLDEIIGAEYPHELGGRMKISRTAIDSGFETQNVYRYVRRHSASRVMAIKGSQRLTTPLGRPSQVDLDTGGHRVEGGATLWNIGVDVLKDELYSWLVQPIPDEGMEPPRGWCSWPEYGQEYFKGLASEERQIRGNRLMWVKCYDRNEPLDCRIYARAASIALGIDRWSEARWERELQDILDSTVSADARPAGAPRERRSRSTTPDWI